MSIPMRRKQCERTDAAFIADVLERAQEMYVAFNSESETTPAPYILPLNYVFINQKIYVHCAVEGRKLQCVEKNPAVGFSAALDICIIPEKATTVYKSVVGTGRMHVVHDVEEKIFALHALAQRYHAHCEHPAPPSMLERTAVLCLEIDTVCGKEKLGKGG